MVSKRAYRLGYCCYTQICIQNVGLQIFCEFTNERYDVSRIMSSGCHCAWLVQLMQDHITRLIPYRSLAKYASASLLQLSVTTHHQRISVRLSINRRKRWILTIFLWSFCMPDTRVTENRNCTGNLNSRGYITSFLNFLLGLASILRVSLNGAGGGQDPWIHWPAPCLYMMTVRL